MFHSRAPNMELSRCSSARHILLNIRSCWFCYLLPVECRRCHQHSVFRQQRLLLLLALEDRLKHSYPPNPRCFCQWLSSPTSPLKPLRSINSTVSFTIQHQTLNFQTCGLRYLHFRFICPQEFDLIRYPSLFYRYIWGFGQITTSLFAIYLPFNQEFGLLPLVCPWWMRCLTLRCFGCFFCLPRGFQILDPEIDRRCYWVQCIWCLGQFDHFKRWQNRNFEGWICPLNLEDPCMSFSHAVWNNYLSIWAKLRKSMIFFAEFGSFLEFTNHYCCGQEWPWPEQSRLLNGLRHSEFDYFW